MLPVTEVRQHTQGFLQRAEKMVVVDKIQAIAQVLVQGRAVQEITFLQVLTLAELVLHLVTLLEVVGEPQLVQQLLVQQKVGTEELLAVEVELML
jgi:hypothetical protein